MDIDKENLKNETKETVNQVKDTLKNVDINKEAKETKSFLKEMLVSPFEKISNIAEGKEEAFKKAIVLLIINIAAAVLTALINAFKYSYGTVISKIGGIIMSAINPIIVIAVPAIIILIMNKTNKKPLTTVIATLVVTSVPEILCAVINIVASLLPALYIVITPVVATLSTIAIIFEFVGMRTLFGEEKETFLTKFAIIKVISSLVFYII